MIRVGDRVRTPEGWTGTVRSLRRQVEPHGGWRVDAGLGPKRARPGELEAAAEQARLYACVDFGPGRFRNYNADVLSVLG